MTVGTREIKDRIWHICRNLLYRSKRRRLSQSGRTRNLVRTHEDHLPVRLPDAHSYTAWAARPGNGGLIAPPARLDDMESSFTAKVADGSHKPPPHAFTRETSASAQAN